MRINVQAVAEIYIKYYKEAQLCLLYPSHNNVIQYKIVQYNSYSIEC